MSVSLRIGIIGGGGWLGGAIAGSLIDAGVVDSRNLCLSYRSTQPRRFPNSSWTSDNQALADRSDVIILSVRPGDWHGLTVDADGKLVISVMAGVRLNALSERHNTGRVVRALPNAAAEVARSYTPWIGASGVTADDRAIVGAIFEACGSQDEVASEGDIDYLTGLSGSGPAFPALLAAAMMSDAVAHGLPAEIARRAVNTVLVGAGRLLERRDGSAADTVAAFLDYRGTTAAAIQGMRAAGFDAAVADGLSAAFKKSVSMGDAS
ncbi:pyrroline-5-carboxylate reductase protein (plasmid) [Rhizobium phaseoli]|uniref:pyrroline-5-carboxylate reductase family protein n=1 Tax=Rhizobium phaseoli TaxID=396 RepID=UPI00031F4024|nr:pyrroline-5-carboxylate reductase dimerization domain-containing protein [Rhizobium phaseoli]ANL31630.1 pyrroline-5-carboxylate reductase protein [Rhizobium phaseoli]ANL44077.1 pyrroline-5-carboxylate reductase protein [Rhizobium phaseoli]ANL57078.1 pyrroline-5-carboxylate reductase protein [Rhizobium phaseoli]ANL63040.1 pyrroline-5-carboxylate reductase protein [Rhizobium phaseoli]ANL69576.1 pyrroline-5-carboxylate reductase protein [Rhizobium phaseoli]